MCAVSSPLTSHGAFPVEYRMFRQGATFSYTIFYFFEAKIATKQIITRRDSLFQRNIAVFVVIAIPRQP